METRKDKLMNLFKGSDNLSLVERLIEEAVSLEAKIEKFRIELDGIEPSPATLDKYKFFHAMYKDNLNQYIQVMKTLGTFAGRLDEDGTSPLREYFAGLLDD